MCSVLVDEVATEETGARWAASPDDVLAGGTALDVDVERLFKTDSRAYRRSSGFNPFSLVVGGTEASPDTVGAGP